MARFGDGLAVDLDLSAATAQATRQALGPLEGHRPDLVCVFVCTAEPGDVEAVAQHVMGMSGARTVVGCSAGGVIGGGKGVEVSPAVSVWAAELPGARVRSFHLDIARTEDSLAVLGLPQVLADDTAMLLLADPYSFPADGFVERSNEVLPGVALVGGIATGLQGAGSTRLVLDQTVYDRGAVGVVLGGPLSVQTVVSQGCRPVGPTMTVTGAEDNVLQELAGVPAIAKLEEIVAELSPDDQALVATGLHLGVAMDEYVENHERGDFLIRNIAGFNLQEGALVIGDLVGVGQTVRFQVRDAKAADEDLAHMLTDFRERGGLDEVLGALLFSCTGRGSNLFDTANHDVLAVREKLKIDGVAGFFAAGEIGPVGGRNHVHGFTASILAFGNNVDGTS